MAWYFLARRLNLPCSKALAAHEASCLFCRFMTLSLRLESARDRSLLRGVREMIPLTHHTAKPMVAKIATSEFGVSLAHNLPLQRISPERSCCVSRRDVRVFACPDEVQFVARCVESLSSNASAECVRKGAQEWEQSGQRLSERCPSCGPSFRIRVCGVAGFPCHLSS